MTESAVFDKPYIKKSAWIGAQGIPERVLRGDKRATRGGHADFRTSRERALDGSSRLTPTMVNQRSIDR